MIKIPTDTMRNTQILTETIREKILRVNMRITPKISHRNHKNKSEKLCARHNRNHAQILT